MDKPKFLVDRKKGRTKIASQLFFVAFSSRDVPEREDTASTETPASGLADKTPALSSDAEDVHKPVTKARACEKVRF